MYTWLIYEPCVLTCISRVYYSISTHGSYLTYKPRYPSPRELPSLAVFELRCACRLLRTAAALASPLRFGSAVDLGPLRKSSRFCCAVVTRPWNCHCVAPDNSAPRLLHHGRDGRTELLSCDLIRVPFPQIVSRPMAPKKRSAGQVADLHGRLRSRTSRCTGADRRCGVDLEAAGVPSLIRRWQTGSGAADPPRACSSSPGRTCACTINSKWLVPQ